MDNIDNWDTAHPKLNIHGQFERYVKPLFHALFDTYGSKEFS
jgi:hypothetical protein